MSSLDNYYQNLLLESVHEQTFEHLFESNSVLQAADQSSQIDINDLQDKVSSSDTNAFSQELGNASVSNDNMIKSIDIMQLKEEFKENIMHFNNQQSQLKKLQETKSSITTLRTNITHQIRLMHGIFRDVPMNEEIIKRLDDINNNIVNTLEIFSCTGMMELEKHIDDAKHASMKARDKLKQGVEILHLTKMIKGMHVCPICLNDEVKIFCIPCGHTFCESCIKTNKCYVCRSQISKVQKLYFV